MTHQITLSLPADLYPKLQAAALASGESESDYVSKVLRNALSPAPLRRASTKKIHITTPIVGLVEGLLFGDSTVGDALKFGSFGLGTLNGLDGEVIILDGEAYRQAAEGECLPVPPDAHTPFMCTTNFEKATAQKLEIELETDWSGLQHLLQEHFPSANIFYAILVEGEFDLVKTRCVRKQLKPRPLVAVAGEQAVFDFTDQRGVLAGFWTPAYLGSALSVPGFHLHYLSDDKRRGGHLLDLKMRRGAAYIQPVYHAETDMPKSADFLEADLMREGAAEELHKAEK